MTANQTFFNRRGGLSSLSLNDVIEQNEIIIKEEPQLLKPSPNLDNDKILEVIKDKSNIFECPSLNTQSLNAKIDQLRAYLKCLDDNKMAE